MNTKLKITLALTLVAVNAALFYYGKDTAHYLVENKEQGADALQTDLQNFYQKAQSLRDPQNNKTTATFLAVGDIMLSRNVAATIKDSGQADLPFSKMAAVLKSTDFNFGNLETPVAKAGGIIGGHSLVFSSPKEYVLPLKDYNFKILSLANNHALDQGLNGLKYTYEFLHQNDIKSIGASWVGSTLPHDTSDAWLPEMVEANGIKISFIGASYASINDNGKTTNNYVARIEEVANLVSSIRKAKTHGTDFVVVTMHAGTEYTRKPNQSQIDFARAAIDAGADMVIGHHPHWVQTIETYNGKYIFYSLGNFIFDQMFSEDTKEGLTLKITISKNKESDLQGSKTPAELESIELLPVIIENYSTPRPATADESKKILEKININETKLR